MATLTRADVCKERGVLSQQATKRRSSCADDRHGRHGRQYRCDTSEVTVRREARRKSPSIICIRGVAITFAVGATQGRPILSIGNLSCVSVKKSDIERSLHQTDHPIKDIGACGTQTAQDVKPLNRPGLSQPKWAPTGTKKNWCERTKRKTTAAQQPKQGPCTAPSTEVPSRPVRVL